MIYFSRFKSNCIANKSPFRERRSYSAEVLGDPGARVGRFFPPIFILLLSVGLLHAQNLVPNPDFETNVGCPSTIGLGGPLLCIPWVNGNGGTCDYLHSCTSITAVTVPTNQFGYQVPHSGNAYAGLLLKATSIPSGLDYREYMQVQLTSPLLPGHAYEIQFYISLGNVYCGSTHMGALVSAGPPAYTNALPINAIPQFESNVGFLNDTMGWTLMEGCFVAHGGEDFLTIGNFHDNASTPLDPFCTGIQLSYYYLDDVSLVEVPLVGIDFDLGDDVTSCFEYTIDPGLSGYQYLWSDGSTQPTLTVTTSGIYVLTVYDGCEGGSDEIEVTILNKPPVELNPGPDTICSGNTYVIDLDPDLGDYEWDDGSVATHYVISSSGIYTVSLDDGCDITSDMIEVFVLEPPEPFSLNDTILCTGTEFEINFDPALGEFLWQDGNTSNSYTIQEGGNYALSISNMCGTASADFSVDEITVPVVNLGAPTVILCENDFIDFTLDPDVGTYIWQDGSAGPEYSITSPGLYSVTVTNVCGQGEDEIEIEGLEAPLFELGDVIHACPGDTIILAPYSLMSTYEWQDGSANDSFLVTTSGTYAVTIENMCGTFFDDVVVMYGLPLVQPNLGADISLCPGETVILSAGNAGGDIHWQDASDADTLVVSSSGVYSVVVSNECFSFTDTVVVNVQSDAPDISLPAQVILCTGESATLDPGIMDVVYQWSDGSSNDTLLVNAPGIYTLSISNACGSDVDSVLVMDGGTVPFISLGSDTLICPGVSFILQPDYLHVEQWNWPDGSSNSFFTVADSGSVYVAVSNQCGTAYDTMDVDLLDDIPVLDLGPDTIICPGQTVTLSVGFPDVDIHWFDGSTGATLQLNNAGNAFATISNMCGVSSDTMMISLLPEIPILDLGPDLPLCPGETLTLSPGISNVNYFWQDGSSDSVFIADHDQLIALTISNTCGSSTDSLQIFLSTDGPQVDLGQDIMACEGQVVTIPANVSGVNYVWQDGSTGSSIQATSSGLFYVEVSNSCGMDSDTIVVDIHGSEPVIDLGPDTTLCDGTSLTLISSPDTETMIMWQDGSVTPEYVVTLSGTYILEATNRCGEDADTTVISFQSLPVNFNLGPDVTLCPHDSLVLTAPVTDDAILWNNGNLLDTLVVSTPGTYELTINNQCGTTSDQIEVFYDDRSLIFPVDSLYKLCPGETTKIDVMQTFPASYHWNTGSVLPSVIIDSPGEFIVTVTTACQEKSQEYIVMAGDNCSSVNEFSIPNIFSPNGDGVNDQFTLSWSRSLNVLSMQGSIFDRWGNMVYSSEENPFSWNGNFNNDKVLPGVYVYIIHVTYMLNSKETSEKFTGDLTVIR